MQRRTSWVIGGIGLVLCGVIAVLGTTVRFSPTSVIMSLLEGALWAAAVIVFAVGRTRAESVVARRTLGMIALFGVAVWPLAATITSAALQSATTVGGEAWSVFGYVSMVIPVGVGAVACVEIVRARVLPDPWRWAPMWVFGASIAVWLLPQLLLPTTGAADVGATVDVLSALGTLVILARTIGLGILALVLAARTRVDVVQVYRSS